MYPTDIFYNLPFFMKFIFMFYCFVIGTCIGSFINVCVYRIPRTETTPVSGRSFCPRCHHALSAVDMIPVFGYILLRGKCRYCGVRISPRYPIVEGLTGLLFMGVIPVYGLTLQAVLVWIFLSCLLTAACIDLDTGTIPNRLSVMIAAAGVVSAFCSYPPSLPHRMAAVLIVGIPFLLLALLGGFGGGDVKLLGACAVFLGLRGAVAGAVLAVLAGGLWGAILLFSGRATGKDHLSFGPFLAGGMTAAVFISHLL